MIVKAYTQGRSIQNHIAWIKRFNTNVTSPNFGLYYLDVVKEYGVSKNNWHNLPFAKDTKAMEKWLAEHDFKEVKDEPHEF